MRNKVANEAGFTLVETMIALIILGVGLMSLAQVFAVGVGQLSASPSDITAREKATDAMESVFTARDTHTLTWAQIRNVKGQSGSDGGVFKDGELPLTTPGADGLLNTADDGAVEAITLPGPDNQLGTGDDRTVPLTTFTREIEIRDLGTNLRRIRVTIKYMANGSRREYKLETYISSFA